MKRIFDFRCSNTNEVFERLVEAYPHTVRCACGAPAKRLISPVKSHLEGISGSFPGAALKWAKDHERAAKQTRQD